MKIVGLTGTSGSGKTTICKLIQEVYNAKVINADQTARDLSKKGTMYLDCIVKEFGNGILYKTGELNRKKLANIIFSDNKKRENLNKITFIHVVDRIKYEINTLQKEQLIILDAPLLFESNLNELCNVIIGVITDEKTKIKRICKRDNIDKEQALRRIKVQKTDEFLIENCDEIIYNKNGLDELKHKIQELKSCFL